MSRFACASGRRSRCDDTTPAPGRQFAGVQRRASGFDRRGRACDAPPAGSRFRAAWVPRGIPMRAWAPPKSAALAPVRPGQPRFWQDPVDLWLRGPLGNVLDYGCVRGERLNRVRSRANRLCGADVDAEALRGSRRKRAASTDRFARLAPVSGRGIRCGHSERGVGACRRRARRAARMRAYWRHPAGCCLRRRTQGC